MTVSLLNCSINLKQWPPPFVRISIRYYIFRIGNVAMRSLSLCLFLSMIFIAENSKAEELISLPVNVAIIPLKNVLKYPGKDFRFCSRPTPNGVSGFWIPSKNKCLKLRLL